MGIIDTVKGSIKAGQKGEALRKVRQHRERLAVEQNQRDIQRYEKIKAERHAAAHPNPVLEGAGVMYEKGRGAIQRVRETKEAIQESREKFASRPGVRKVRESVSSFAATLGTGFEQHATQPRRQQPVGRQGKGYPRQSRGGEHIRSPSRSLGADRGGGGGLQYRGFGDSGGTGMGTMMGGGMDLPGFGNIITPSNNPRDKFYRPAPMASPDFMNVFWEEPRYPRRKGQRKKKASKVQEQVIRIRLER